MATRIEQFVVTLPRTTLRVNGILKVLGVSPLGGTTDQAVVHAEVETYSDNYVIYDVVAYWAASPLPRDHDEYVFVGVVAGMMPSTYVYVRCCGADNAKTAFSSFLRGALDVFPVDMMGKEVRHTVCFGSAWDFVASYDLRRSLEGDNLEVTVSLWREGGRKRKPHGLVATACGATQTEAFNAAAAALKLQDGYDDYLAEVAAALKTSRNEK